MFWPAQLVRYIAYQLDRSIKMDMRMFFLQPSNTTEYREADSVIGGGTRGAGGLSPSVKAEIIHKLTASYLNC